MKYANKLGTNTAIAILWLLIVFGLLFEIYLIPATSADLSARYTEFKGDGLSIGALLTCIVAFGQLVLALIAVLLRRISKSQLLHANTQKVVQLLSAVMFAVAGSCATLLGWLMNQNALPGAVFIGLVVSICLGAAAGLVLISLASVLREAIAAKTELEAVI